MLPYHTSSGCTAGVAVLGLEGSWHETRAGAVSLNTRPEVMPSTIDYTFPA